MNDSGAGSRFRRVVDLFRKTVKNLHTEGLFCTLRKIYRFLMSWSAISSANDTSLIRYCRRAVGFCCKTVKYLREGGVLCILRKIYSFLRAGMVPLLETTSRRLLFSYYRIRCFRSTREKIAVFSPIPPTPSGVAYYTYYIHHTMPKVYDIITDKSSLTGFRAFIRLFFENIVLFDCFQKNLPAYKAKIFLFGNSTHYDFVWDEAVRTKGEPGRYLYAHEALLHRAFLNRLLAKTGGVQQYLEKYYPEKQDIIRSLKGQDLNLFCIHNAIYGARVLVEETGIDTIFVNNKFCGELIYNDLTEEQKKRVKIETFFLPMDEHRKIRAVKRSVPPSVHLIGTFGSWSFLKKHEQIVAAVNKLNADGIPVKLLVATRKTTSEMCQQQGVDTSNCLFVNTEDDEYFLRLEKSVELAILLRTGLHGNNCSGCLSQAWGMKVPVISNKGFPLPEFEPYCHLLSSDPSVDEIAKGIRDALENPPRVMSDEKLESLSFRSAAKAIYSRVSALEARRIPYSARIYVDATLFDGHGIQRMIDRLYRKLRELRPEFEIVYILSSKHPVDTDSPCRRVYIPGRDREEEIFQLLMRDRPDVVHFPWNGSFGKKFAAVRSFAKIITTVHDIIPAMIPDSFGMTQRDVDIFLAGVKNSVEVSDWIFFDSDNSRKDFCNKTGWNGKNCDTLYFAPLLSREGKNISKTQQKQNSYFLYNGGYTPRKCIDLLVKNYLAARQSGKISSDLVLTGHINHFSPEFAKNIRTGAQKGWIRELGFVSETELSGLLANALALYYPSLYEGFGIPPLEAMNIGCPVVTTKISSIPEVCGDSAYYMDPRDDAAFIESFCRMEQDEQLRNTLIEQGEKTSKKFSWDLCVHKFADRLDLIMSPNNAQARR